MIEVPRSLLSEFLKMPESEQVALYFLFGEEEDGLESKVYIGQTGDLRARLVSHNKEKSFWQKALVLISRTQNMTGTHTLFLEWHCLQATRKAARYTDENGNAGTKPYTPAPLAAECLEIFETGQTLLSTLGYPVFDPVAVRLSPVQPVAAPAPIEAQEDLFFCRSSGADGRGLYTQEGFVVLAGSIGRKENVPSLDDSLIRFRNRLLETGVTREDGENIIFQKDHLFRSPTAAGIALMGRRNNGWTEWRNAAGQTLDAVKRQTMNGL